MRRTNIIAATVITAAVLSLAGCTSTAPTETPVSSEVNSVENTEEATAEATGEATEEATKEEGEAASEDENATSQEGNQEAGEAGELGQKLIDTFKEEVANTTDPQALAEKLSNADLCGQDCGTIEVEEGFLNGFDNEIKGFNKGVMFSPWIGSIPFVGYVFETDDAEALKATLLENKNPRWNICTEAKYTVVEVQDKLVFFAMLPGEDEGGDF